MASASAPLSKLERRILIGVALGVLVYAVMAIWADVDALQRELAGFQWGWFGLALVLAFGNYIVRFGKWHYFTRLLDIRLPLRESFLVFLASFVLTVTPGKVGEVLKSYLLKRSRNIPIARTAPIVVAERLTDLLALLVLGIIGAASYAYGLKAILVSALVVVAGMVFLSSQRAVMAFLRLLERLPVVKRIAGRLEAAYESMRVLITPGPLLISTAISVVGWGLECVAFHGIIGGFAGAHPDLFAAGFLYALTTVLGALSFLPGGLGVTEGSMGLGLVELSLLPNQSAAVAATVLIRLATLWFAVGVGLIALAAYRRRYLSGADPAVSSAETAPEP